MPVSNLTESLFVVKNVLEFDLKILSLICENECNEYNKYVNLYEHYMKTNKPIYANSVMLELFNTLAVDFSFPSEIYNDFLKLYSKNDNE